MLSTLLALYEGIGGIFHKGPVSQNFAIFFLGSLNKLLNKQSSYGCCHCYKFTINDVGKVNEWRSLMWRLYNGEKTNLMMFAFDD